MSSLYLQESAIHFLLTDGSLNTSANLVMILHLYPPMINDLCLWLSALCSLEVEDNLRSVKIHTWDIRLKKKRKIDSWKKKEDCKCEYSILVLEFWDTELYA